jgi:transcriptional regulator with XRE-family HTH domain
VTRHPVWHDERMRSSLANHDLASAYRMLQRHGVSQRRIAAATAQSQSEICEIMGGRRVISYDVLARVADGFRVPRGWMGLSYDDESAAYLAVAPSEPQADASCACGGTQAVLREARPLRLVVGQ